MKCHSDERPRGHFRLTSRESALRGGEHGIDILPGKSSQSPLVGYVARLDEETAMPPEGRGAPLSTNEISLVRAWIDQGVSWEGSAQEPGSGVEAEVLSGGTAVRGNSRSFEELTWQRDGWNGGLEKFDVWQRPTPDSKIEISGHVIADDYHVEMSAEKNDLGFARLGWTEFRRYYDENGGYFPLFSPPTFSLGRDLHMDIGRAWTEFGLTLPNWPSVVVGYEYQYRQGAEATLQWGPVGNGTQIRNIYPSFEDISEKVHVLKLDANYELAGFSVSDRFRGEWLSPDNSKFNEGSLRLGGAGMALTVARDQERYFQGANTIHIEKQLTDGWFASGGYLYSKLSGDGVEDVATLNPALLDPNFVAPGWNSQLIQLSRESHVFSISSLLGPWQGLSVSVGTQNEWTRQSGLATASVNIALPFAPFLFPLDQPESLHSDLDRAVFSQDIGLRFTSIPFTTVFADARFRQDTTGQYEQEINGLTPFLRDTDMKAGANDIHAGFNTSPLRRVSLTADLRRYDNRTDYDTRFREPVDLQGYPAFILWRDLLSEQARVKLGVQMTSWLKISLSYERLQNHYRTATEPVTDLAGNIPGGISPGGGFLAGTYNSSVTSANATLTPWRKFFISSTFAFQQAKTQTEVNDNSAVLPYAGNIYTAMANATYALNERTEVVAGYSFSTANFAQNNFEAGLPLGTHYHQHAVQAGLTRRLGKNRVAGLQYRYYRYNDSSVGNTSGFEAQAVFATLAWRLP